MRNLLVELFVEELPPKALKKLGEAFAGQLAEQLRALGLANGVSMVTPFASPRRLAAHITHVAAKAADKAVQQKLMPVSVGLDANGLATPALLKKLQALGVDVSDPVFAVAGLRKAVDGKAEALFYDSQVSGATLDVGLQQALDVALSKLPIPKVMSYQLETDCELPGWTSVNFVRPAHGLVALHGDTVVPVKVLGLTAGNSTQGHRFEATKSPVVLEDADSYAQTLREDGAVIASFAERRADIVQQLKAAAAQVGHGVRAIEDEALLDEVTALVERPHVLVCQFEPEFLDVPQECLILTMKANQKYFPLLDAQGKLTNQFLVVSNINPQDASAVVGGNERVVRPRLADAKFFYDQDRKKTLASRVAGLDKVVYHNKLGTQGERMGRVCDIARAIAELLVSTGAGSDLVTTADTAARLAKTDLLTDMVGEFPELQGIMGAYYALNDGLSTEVAQAIEDHYKPRFAGDDLPRNLTGVVVALADKLETLVGLFGIGNLPTGDKDPFALRRHALGVIRMLVEKDLPLSLAELLEAAIPVFGDKIADPTVALTDFIFDRLAGSLREQGFSALEVDAVLALRPQRLGEVPKRLAAVRAFAALPEAPALAAANKRISNILKKADAAAVADAHVSELLLQEPAEQALYAAMQDITPRAQAQLDAGDYATSLQTLAALRVPVDAFFEDVMVNAEALDLRLNRLGLLKTLHQAMNQVADLSRLAA
ncbi:glycine--tRNA ligase subunit beta [Rhodoferax fermentans]|uniref:Glycine--tRNA ligase beta subunit n=1 Tax=Rhodoferax fermentans TaxID=28066 RepID=A0A1T1AXM0_RHOFE|nr:glycine--tRNA ligase subunit beta [Rhodoferax fermentans]MBK1683792.1 glycine--tRNA ligase subunit beta [Rhodoferax fermentans]OOV08723.1 glycine--tRNA ligase subunit beta [Rhodoferax fermentans]